MILKVLFLGKCEYREALEIQYKLLEKRQKGQIEDTLIIVEHPPVITLGNQAEKANIIVSGEYLKQQGIDIIETNRGGDVTYHGYGQIVGYPIVDIKNAKIGVRDFVNGLEEVFIQLLQQELGIASERSGGQTGVWVGNNKILAIGLAIKRGVTMHGFAFNVNTNLQHFSFIVPCGITDKGVTSVEKLTGKAYSMEEMNKKVVDYFVRVFNYQGFEIVEGEI
ncbi:MAG: lipB [Clostridia bacterium]|nr:lipB [Clostridia bacterium]